MNAPTDRILPPPWPRHQANVRVTGPLLDRSQRARSHADPIAAIVNGKDALPVGGRPHLRRPYTLLKATVNAPRGRLVSTVVKISGKHPGNKTITRPLTAGKRPRRPHHSHC